MASAATVPTVPHSIFRLKLAILGHLWPCWVPTCCQDVPNLTPRSPKRAQLVAKIAQNTPQEPPTRPPKTPKCAQNVVALSDFTLRPFFKRSLPRPPKMLKIAPQMALRWPSWPQLGPPWRQLGAHLAPSWAI